MADIEHLHPIFRERLLALLDATGCTVVSGWRSSDDQARLYRDYLDNRGNPANPPGLSNHEGVPNGPPAALAVDLSGDLAAAHGRCGEFGIHFPIVTVEPWHAQPVEVPYAYFTGIPPGWMLGEGGRYQLARPARGQAVIELQQRLNLHGTAVAVDGDFGPQTEQAVKAFQASRAGEVNGVADAATWAVLDAEPTNPGLMRGPLPGAGREEPIGLRLSSQGAAELAHFECVMLCLYNDPVGNCTFGIGHLVHLGPIDGRSEEAEFSGDFSRSDVYKLFLERDAPRFEEIVRNGVQVPLYQSEYDALISFVYNVGPGALDPGESTLARLLNDGDYTGAADQFGRWVHADQRVLPGLVKRRAAEAALFRSQWQSSPPPPSPSPQPSYPVFAGRIMGNGGNGDDVLAMQRQLVARGWLSIAPDGSFGPATESVIRKFQAEKGLGVDGLVGPKTWDAIWRSPITPRLGEP